MVSSSAMTGWGERRGGSMCREHALRSGRDLSMFIRIKNRRLGYFDQKSKTSPADGRRREHGHGCPRQSRERRARWGARWANTTPNGGHHLEWRKLLRLKTSSTNCIWLFDCWDDMANMSIQPRADARLRSAHPPSYRRCTRRQNWRRVNAT